jgi:hypothetical protein
LFCPGKLSRFLQWAFPASTDEGARGGSGRALTGRRSSGTRSAQSARHAGKAAATAKQRAHCAHTVALTSPARVLPDSTAAHRDIASCSTCRTTLLFKLYTPI